MTSQHLESFARKNMMFLLMIFLVFFFSLSTSGHLDMFANVQTHYSFFNGPQFQITYEFTIYAALYVC